MEMLAGLLTALAILFVIFKLGNWRKVLFFDVLIDVSTTVVLAVVFAGTASGMVIAFTAGFFISVFLWLMKKTFGCDKLTLKGWETYENHQENNRVHS